MENNFYCNYCKADAEPICLSHPIEVKKKTTEQLKMEKEKENNILKAMKEINEYFKEKNAENEMKNKKEPVIEIDPVIMNEVVTKYIKDRPSIQNEIVIEYFIRMKTKKNEEETIIEEEEEIIINEAQGWMVNCKFYSAKEYKMIMSNGFRILRKIEEEAIITDDIGMI